jgi:signal transduction histidine kinase
MRRSLAVFVLFLAYVASARFGLSLASVDPSITPVWPPTGIAIAGALILGRAAWLPIFVAAFVANVGTVSVATSMSIAFGNVLEAAIGAYLAGRWAGGLHMLDRPARIFRFAVLMAPATAVSATVGVAALSAEHAAGWISDPRLWLTWWIGDLSGALLVTPLVLAWRDPDRWSVSQRSALEEALLVIAVGVSAAVTFGEAGPWPPHAPLEFLTIPPIVWAAFRFGQRETTTAVALLSTIATWTTLRGYGPFALESANTSLLIAEAFVAMLMATMVPMTAAVVEWKRARVARAEMLARAQAARQAAEAASAAKDEFLAMLGHELRNPLGAISSAVHVAGVADVPPQAARAAHEVITRQVRHLTTLVDDLLDVTRVKTGKITLHRQPLELSALVSRCVEAVKLSGRAGRSAAVIHVDVGEGAGALWVNGDSTRLEQVVTNLLANAVKYTPAEGSIRVAVGRDGECGEVRVMDTGIGIDAALLPRIFDQFVQADRGPARSEGGLGLGLTLVKRLVELHGGTVSAASDGRGSGSTFVVRLPTTAPPPTAPAPPEARGTRRRVLIVEDQEDARAMMRVALEMAGHEVFEAADGPSGLEAIGALGPDVGLIDIGLPGFDGWELARQIRAKLGDSVVLIAITGYGQPEDKDRAQAAGFDLHLVKPIDPLRLATIVGTARSRDAGVNV